MDRLSEEVLDADTCRNLLATLSVGRIAVSVVGWPPVIRPVSYAYDESSRSIVFRSGRGSKLTALLLSGHAAFEVDSVDEITGLAWSVIAQGRTEEITDPSELVRIERLGVQRWAPGDKPHWLRIRPEVISGRSLRRSVPRESPPMVP